MDPGTALALVSLTFEGFAGCIKAFNLISEAGNLGHDAAIEHTKLLLQEHRLVEWAKAVHIDVPGAQVVASVNQSLAALLLAQLEQLLSSTERLKQRYRLELLVQAQDSGKLEQFTQTGDRPQNAGSVLAKIVSPQTRKEILDRSAKVKTANAFPKRFWWAAVDKQKLSLLVSDVTGIVDGLWTLLDTATRASVSRAIGRDLTTTLAACSDIVALKQLQSALGPGSKDAGLSSTLSDSAGLKATILRTAALDADTGQGAAAERKKREMALCIDPVRLSGERSVANHQLTVGLLDQQPVLLETKPVEQQKLKGKLRTRVVDLATLLSEPSSRTLLTLPCLGYVEESYGFRLVFRLPPKPTMSPSPSTEPKTLLNMLCDSHSPLPSAGVRLHLAFQIAKTVLSFHAAGWLHKDIRSANIVLLPSETSTAADEPYLDLSQPILTGFSFARRDRPAEISDSVLTHPERDIYRHPVAMTEQYEGFSRSMDAYALGCVLVEIAEWAPLRKIIRKCVDIGSSIQESQISALPAWLRARYVGKEGMAGFRLGGAFATLVTLCFSEGDKEVELVEFLDALEGLGRCWVEPAGAETGRKGLDEQEK